MFAHTHPENVDRFVSVSAAHPNLMWDNLQSKSPINDYWLKFVQLPYLPEIEMTRTDSKFIERTLPHLNKDSSNKYSQIDPTIQQIPNKLDAYKYVFSRKSDWSGPLNYYRNLPFYRVKPGETLRCLCLIVIGKLSFVLLSINCFCLSIKMFDWGNYFGGLWQLYSYSYLSSSYMKYMGRFGVTHSPILYQLFCVKYFSISFYKMPFSIICSLN